MGRSHESTEEAPGVETDHCRARGGESSAAERPGDEAEAALFCKRDQNELSKQHNSRQKMKS